MSNYYYSPQQTLMKQSSQILAPAPLQAHLPNGRGSLTDRPQQDLKNSYILAPNVYVMQTHLVREGSIKHLHDPQPSKFEQPSLLQSRSGAIQNQRAFSDYQINVPTVRGEDSQLPNGGGLNITNKIGEKIKNKTDLHKSNSKATLTNSEQYSKVSSVRFVDSIIDSEKGDSGRMEAVLEQLSTEIVKLGEKWAVQEERLDRLEKSCKKNEENSANVFSSPQMEEINKILSLVEKSEQRDDYRKTIKMIEELRVNILDLHSEVKNLESPPLTPPEHNFNQIIETVKGVVAESVREREAELKKAADEGLAELRKSLLSLQAKWEQWRTHEDSDGNIASSVKKFQGKMVTLLYEQRIINTSNTLNPISPIAKNAAKGDNIPIDKQNSASILTTKTYHIDPSGYLLDKNKYYLLNSKGDQIRLTEKELALLKKHNIL